VTAARRGDLDLAPLVEALAPFGVLVAARRIRAGDEDAFPDCEGMAPLDIARRRASGAARLAARLLLPELRGEAAAPLLPRSASGAPVWPEGLIGSLAHDESYAVAAVAARGTLLGLGVDIEPSEPLPQDVEDFVLTEAERRETARNPVAGRLVFTAKEAVYKAVHPLDGSALEYSDIEISLGEGRATLRDGRRLKVFWLAGLRLLAVALVQAHQAG
jgi:4'-phosphopantetheinyl transferase EntD